jgi:hypothetical protein
VASILPLRPEFDDELTRLMGEAFDTVTSREQSEIIKEIFAKQIIEAVKNGERDTNRICDTALAALGIRLEAR